MSPEPCLSSPLPPTSAPGFTVAGGSTYFKKQMANRRWKKRSLLSFLGPQGGSWGGQRSLIISLSPMGRILFLPFLRPGAPAPPHPGAPGPPKPLGLRDLQRLWVDRGQSHPTTSPPQSTNSVDPHPPTHILPSLQCPCLHPCPCSNAGCTSLTPHRCCGGQTRKE